MSIRLLILGLLGLGAVGQLACSETAEAAQATAASELDASKKDGEPTGGQFCGGFAAIRCPEGLVCVDDPNDTCDPSQSGFDCGGVCVVPTKDEKQKCDYNDPELSYVSRDPQECAATLFQCPEGATPFFTDCGCGCKKPQACNYEDPNRRYVARDPEQCAAIRFFCNSGEQPFFDSCGCGCEPASAP